MVNSEGTEWGLGREKSATIREIGRVPITSKVNVFVFYLENQLGVNYGLDWYFGLDLVLINRLAFWVGNRERR